MTRSSIKNKDHLKSTRTYFKLYQKSSGKHERVSGFVKESFNNSSKTTSQQLLKKHVIAIFLKRFNIYMKYIQYNKKLAKNVYRSDISKWLALTRQRLLKVDSQDSFDEKWCHIKPNQPFSVGQTLIPFVLNTKWTYKKIYHTKQQGKDQFLSLVQVSKRDNAPFKSSPELKVSSHFFFMEQVNVLQEGYNNVELY